MKYKCPVCLNETLEEPYEAYSYDICRTCGVEYGYDDAIDEYDFTKEDWETKAPALLAENHSKLRQIWIDAGSPNWWEETQQPDFEGGVRWFRDYYKKHPLEKEQWEDNLCSMFKDKIKELGLR